MAVVHLDLRRVARNRLRADRRAQTLQPTALVHEAYLRLIDLKRIKWQNRAHFFAVAARVMRRVLVDAARASQSAKRGGDAVRVSFDAAMVGVMPFSVDVLVLDEALQALAGHDARKAQVVELRFFGGLTEAEASAVLGVSPETVRRDWKFAKAWLGDRLSQ